MHEMVRCIYGVRRKWEKESLVLQTTHRVGRTKESLFLVFMLQTPYPVGWANESSLWKKLKPLARTRESLELQIPHPIGRGMGGGGLSVENKVP